MPLLVRVDVQSDMDSPDIRYSVGQGLYVTFESNCSLQSLGFVQLLVQTEHNCMGNHRAKKEFVVLLLRKIMKSIPFYIFLLLVFGFTACGGDKAVKDGRAKDSLEALRPVYDLDSILASGEIVVATLRGADTYTAFDDTVIGFQYALADSLAQYLGVRLRMEVAEDTAQMLALLHSDSIDVYALWLDRPALDTLPVTASDPRDTLTRRSWAVRKGAVQLADALQEWATSELQDSV